MEEGIEKMATNWYNTMSLVLVLLTILRLGLFHRSEMKEGVRNNHEQSSIQIVVQVQNLYSGIIHENFFYAV